MVRTAQVQYSYPNGRHMRYPDLEASPAAPLLITGRSGSGKTTFLHLLSALLPLQQGDIWIGDTALRQLPAAQTDRFRGRHIGLVLQQHHFVQSLTAGENIQLAAWLGGRAVSLTDITALAHTLDVANLLHRRPAQLSLGEQQRISLARALINKPSVLLADEPTSSLDDDNAATVASLLTQVAQQQHCTLVVVTHDNRLKPFFQNSIHLP